MNKIKELQQIVDDNTISFSEKLDKVRSNPMDFAMTLLLLGETHEFEQVFPLKQITENPDLINDYRDPLTDSLLFNACLQSEDLVLLILKNIALAKQINEITGNGILVFLNKRHNDNEFIQKMLDHDLIDRYLVFESLANNFFNVDFDDPAYFKKLNDFILLNSSFFTIEYFDAYDLNDKMKPFLFEYLHSQITSKTDIIEFCRSYCDEDLFLSKMIPTVSLDSFVNILLKLESKYSSSDESKLFNIRNIKRSQYFEKIESRILDNKIEIMDRFASTELLSILDDLLSPESLVLLLDCLFDRHAVGDILKSNWLSNSIVHKLSENHQYKMNIYFIKNGDYSKISDLEMLISSALTEDQLIVALYDYMKENSWETFDSEVLNRIPGYLAIKEKLANKLFNDEVLSSYQQYVHLDLSMEWHLNHSDTEFIVDLIREENEVKLLDLIKIDPLVMKKRIIDSIKSEKLAYYSESVQSFAVKFLLNNNLQTEKELVSLLAKAKIDMDNVIESLPSAVVKTLLQKNSKESKIHFLKSPHTPQHIKDEIIDKMNTYEIYGYQRSKWLGADLTSEQLTKLWEKVSNEDNRTIKEFMFDYLRFYKQIADQKIVDSIIKRASKLKGFEDIMMEDSSLIESDPKLDAKLLAKKFTKAISSEKGAKDALYDVEYFSLLNESNILRIFNKMTESFSSSKKELLFNIRTKKYPFDVVSFTVNDESISILLGDEHIADELLLEILHSKTISTTFKIKLIKKTKLHRLSIDENVLNAFDIKLILSLLDNVTNKDFVLKLNNENRSKIMGSASHSKILLLMCDGLKTNKEYSDMIELILMNNKNAFQNKDFVSAIIDSISMVDNSNFVIVELLMDHSPQQFFEKKKYSIVNNLDLGEFYKKIIKRYLQYQVEFELEQFNTNIFIINMSLFSTDELQMITSKLVEQNFDNINSKYLIKYIQCEMTPFHRSLLINERTKTWVPIELWPIGLISAQNKPKPDQWVSFLNAKNLSSYLIQLTTSEKEILVAALLDYTPELGSDRASKSYLHQIKIIYDNKKYFNIQESQLDLLWFKLNDDMFLLLLNDIEDFSLLLEKLSDNSKNYILSKIIKILNENNEIEPPACLFAILPMDHALRSVLIHGATKKTSIEYVLKNILSEAEIDRIVDNIIQNKIKLSIDSDNDSDLPCIQMLMPKLLNAYVESDFYLVSDDNGSITIKPPIYGYNRSLGSEKDCHPLINVINAERIKKICSNVNAFYPEKIPGMFDFIESQFIPNKEIAIDTKVAQLLDCQRKFESDLNTSDLLEGLHSFGKINKVKANAVRSFNYQDQIEYVIKIEFNAEQLAFKTRLYDQEVLNLLQKKEVDLERIINERLIINNERTFGFELEFSSNKSKNEISDYLKENIEINHPIVVHNAYLSSNGKSWDLKIDSSVSATIGFAMELASPILAGKDGIKETQLVLDSIFNKFQVDTSEAVAGGLHVHHDIKDLLAIKSKKAELLEKFHTFQESLYSICAYHRNDESYCEKISMESIKENDDFGRIGLNISKYNTMEFRMRETMSDVNSIIRWITITQQVVDSVVFGLKDQMELFHKNALDTLETIQLEKALQLKKMTNNQLFMSELDRYNQARIFSDLLLEKQLKNS